MKVKWIKNILLPILPYNVICFSALKKKIKIEELLHYSVGAESGHNVDKNFTSNLMNLVMQFRKVNYTVINNNKQTTTLYGLE